jgi:hypothetical protein
MSGQCMECLGFQRWEENVQCECLGEVWFANDGGVKYVAPTLWWHDLIQ